MSCATSTRERTALNEMHDILAKIVESKRARLATAKASRPVSAMGDGRKRKQSEFRVALRRDAINIIAEMKYRSPSKGVIRSDFNPAVIAENYVAGGAAAISVLTEEDFFGGSLEHLRTVRQVTSIPLLRKDFIVELETPSNR